MLPIHKNIYKPAKENDYTVSAYIRLKKEKLNLQSEILYVKERETKMRDSRIVGLIHLVILLWTYTCTS